MKVSIRGKGLVLLAFVLGIILSSLGFYYFLDPATTESRSTSPATWYSTIQNPDPIEDEIAKTMNSFFKDDFFAEDAFLDPFKDMQKMREQLFKNFKQFGNFPSLTDTSTEISSREDEAYVYYEIPSHNLDRNSLNIELQGSMLSISGEIKKSKEENANTINQRSVYISRFQRSFPVPNNVEANKMQVDSSTDKITIKFPKKIS